MNKHDIRPRRLALGWTQRRLSDESGVSERTVARIEANGKHTAQPAILTVIEAALIRGEQERTK